MKKGLLTLVSLSILLLVPACCCKKPSGGRCNPSCPPVKECRTVEVPARAVCEETTCTEVRYSKPRLVCECPDGSTEEMPVSGRGTKSKTMKSSRRMNRKSTKYTE